MKEFIVVLIQCVILIALNRELSTKLELAVKDQEVLVTSQSQL